MEDKKIKVVINSETIELESNNPDLKSLINLILSQEENFNFDTIEIKTDDDKFDKDSFKEILIESINEFKNKIKLLEIKKVADRKIIKELIEKSKKKMSKW